MEESQLVDKENTLQNKHLFMMITLSVFIALMLVGISMAIYYSSGAAQLDLSRPGYKDVRGKVINSDTFQNYTGSGPINQVTITEFKSLYDQQAKKIESVDAFGGDPLSPDALDINIDVIQ